MQLFAASSPVSPSVSVQIYNPSTNGTLGSVYETDGTASGDLTTPSGVTMNNTQSVSLLDQDLTLGSFFDVFVTLSGREIGSSPTGHTGTQFYFGLVDGASGELHALGVVSGGTVNWSTSSDGIRVIPLTAGVPSPRASCCSGWGWEEPSR